MGEPDETETTEEPVQEPETEPVDPGPTDPANAPETGRDEAEEPVPAPDDHSHDDEASEPSHPARPGDEDDGDRRPDVGVDVNVTNDNRAPDTEGAGDGPERGADGEVGGADNRE
jgi:hypothetical protein